MTSAEDKGCVEVGNTNVELSSVQFSSRWLEIKLDFKRSATSVRCFPQRCQKSNCKVRTTDDRTLITV